MSRNNNIKVIYTIKSVDNFLVDKVVSFRALSDAVLFMKRLQNEKSTNNLIGLPTMIGG